MICKTKDCLDNIGDSNKDFKHGCVAWGDEAPQQCKDYKSDEATAKSDVDLLVSQLWYSRDASWWDRPDTSKPKKLHLMVGTGLALCGINVWLNKESEWENPPEALECKGCKNKKL